MQSSLLPELTKQHAARRKEESGAVVDNGFTKRNAGLHPQELGKKSAPGVKEHQNSTWAGLNLHVDSDRELKKKFLAAAYPFKLPRPIQTTIDVLLVRKKIL